MSDKPTDYAPEQLTQLSRAIAHDFNNLLCSILGNAELLSLDGCDDLKHQRRVKSIRNSASRGVELTRKLAGFGAVEAIHPTSIDVGEVLREDFARFRSTLPATMEFVVDIPSKTMFFAERSSVQQVVAELLCNAREFSKPMGKIRIEIRRDEDGNGILRVSDNGPGFPDSLDQSDLVKAFVSTEKPGKGIGLAFVNARLQAHGGHVRLFNDRGAVAKCHFPAQARTEEKVVDVLSVWVVEDEPALLEFIVDVLSTKGFIVSAFSDSEALLEAYSGRDDRPDVLLLDVILPKKSGPDLLRALYQRGFKGSVLWSSGLTADAADLVVDGPFSFLQKPYTASELNRAIRDLASR
jgi:CheY-like chemotaxis protein